LNYLKGKHPNVVDILLLIKETETGLSSVDLMKLFPRISIDIPDLLRDME